MVEITRAPCGEERVALVQDVAAYQAHISHNRALGNVLPCYPLSLVWDSPYGHNKYLRPHSMRCFHIVVIPLLVRRVRCLHICLSHNSQYPLGIHRLIHASACCMLWITHRCHATGSGSRNKSELLRRVRLCQRLIDQLETRLLSYIRSANSA